MSTDIRRSSPSTPIGRSVACHALGLSLCLAAPFAVAQAPSPETAAKLRVLDAFLGSWEVTVRIRQPVPSVVTNIETYEWALGGHFLRGDSGLKSDGTRDLVIATYVPAADGYPLWIFSSSGAWFYLEPGKWDERARTIEWKHAPNSPISYRISCEFPDDRTRHCVTLVKDWKGTVLHDQELSAVRRP